MLDKIEFVYQSNLIENIDVPKENLCEDLAKEDSNSHMGTLMVAEGYGLQGIKIDAAVIKGLHRRIMTEQITKNLDKVIPTDAIGDWRRCGVAVGGHTKLMWEKVPEYMDNYIESIYLVQIEPDAVDDLIGFIADSHYYFENIHPFMDGNGRTGRILIAYLMWYFGYEPFVFTSEDKHESYYPACEDKLLMREYFKKKAMI